MESTLIIFDKFCKDNEIKSSDEILEIIGKFENNFTSPICILRNKNWSKSYKYRVVNLFIDTSIDTENNDRCYIEKLRVFLKCLMDILFTPIKIDDKYVSYTYTKPADGLSKKEIVENLLSCDPSSLCNKRGHTCEECKKMDIEKGSLRCIYKRSDVLFETDSPVAEPIYEIYNKDFIKKFLYDKSSLNNEDSVEDSFHIIDQFIDFLYDYPVFFLTNEDYNEIPFITRVLYMELFKSISNDLELKCYMNPPTVDTDMESIMK